MFGVGATSATLCRLPGYIGGEPEQPVPRDVVAVMIERDAGAGTPLLAAPHDALGFRRCVLAGPAGAAFTISRVARA